MFSHRRAGPLFSAIALALFAGVGCQTKAVPPFQAPAAKLTLTHFAGGPLSGPTTRPIQASDPNDAYLVNLRLVALEENPTSILRSVEPDVRLIAVSRGGVPVLPISRLTQDCRWDLGQGAAELDARLASQALGRSAEMNSYEIAVPTGSSASVVAADAASKSAHSISIILQRQLATTQPSLTIGVTIETDVAVEARESAEAAARPESAKAQPPAPPRMEHLRELALLKPVTVAGPTPIALLIPFPTDENQDQAMLALLTVAPGRAGPAMSAALARAVEDSRKNGSSGTVTPQMGPDLSAWPGLKAILDGTLERGYSRASLAYAAAQTKSDICQDVVLVADDAALARLMDLVQKRLAAQPLSPSNESIEWALDSASLELLSSLQTDSQLSPELYSVLLRHTGEAGYNSGTVEEILNASGSSADFASRIRAENLVFLEDPSPGARVRAYDWLALRGQAPEGYDPLAALRERRAALEKLWDAMSGTNAVEGGKP